MLLVQVQVQERVKLSNVEEWLEAAYPVSMLTHPLLMKVGNIPI